MTKPIITSILDNDAYTFFVGQAVQKLYPDIEVEYHFFNRDETDFPQGFDHALREQIDMMTLLSLSYKEKKYMNNLYTNGRFYFTGEYVDWLSDYKFDPNEVEITQYYSTLTIKIKGLWSRTIMWEVPLLRLVSALYYQMTNQKPTIDYVTLAKEKATKMLDAKIKVSDFGSRRAFSPEVHRNVVETLTKYGRRQDVNTDSIGFVSTSNVQLAMEIGIPPSGTNSHQWVMGHAAMYGVKLANQTANTTWLREYDKPLRTVLPDTYTTDFFLATATEEMLNEIDTFRQDSGDPVVIARKIIDKLKQYGLTNIRNHWEGSSKNILFSDSLNLDKAIDITTSFNKSDANLLFGIGTNLTNDVGVNPLNIVIKPVAFRVKYINPYMQRDNNGWIEVCKLSDHKGKYSGSNNAIKNALQDVKEITKESE